MLSALSPRQTSDTARNTDQLYLYQPWRCSRRGFELHGQTEVQYHCALFTTRFQADTLSCPTLSPLVSSVAESISLRGNTESAGADPWCATAEQAQHQPE